MTEIKFNGKEDCILEIIHNLPRNSKAIRNNGKSITIPTSKGARDVYIGDVVIVDGENVSIIEK